MGRHVTEVLRIPVMSVSQSGHVQIYVNLHVTYGLENGMTRLWYCVVFFSGSVTIKESRSQVRPRSMEDMEQTSVYYRVYVM